MMRREWMMSMQGDKEQLFKHQEWNLIYPRFSVITGGNDDRSTNQAETSDEKSTIWASVLRHEGRYYQEAERLRDRTEEETDYGEKEILVFETALYLCMNAFSKNSINNYRQMFSLIRNFTKSSNDMMRFPRPENIHEKLWILSSRCQVVMFMKLFEARTDEIKESLKIIADSDENSHESSSYEEAIDEIIDEFSWLYECHEIWKEANALITANNADFFSELDEKMGVLTMQSSIPDLVCYVQLGMNKIRDLRARVQLIET